MGEEKGGKAAQKGAASQLRQNQAAKTIICEVCRQTWMGTAREPELIAHHASKHSKLTLVQCFPHLSDKAPAS
eukprot:NODE_4308_length_352_cov_278.917492_g3709_i0.p1 GENE.NODE_4308_length_352_cov_278.917492_g3709_i0~~NODE_4308_length_352_cov_278.917492_g3709_i0.p1  ORF type:complete len:80 (-),score=22.80 NODE_4308_length_352_cov_278.917492_g3709_i0:112-330(-)